MQNIFYIVVTETEYLHGNLREIMKFGIVEITF